MRILLDSTLLDFGVAFLAVLKAQVQPNKPQKKQLDFLSGKANAYAYLLEQFGEVGWVFEGEKVNKRWRVIFPNLPMKIYDHPSFPDGTLIVYKMRESFYWKVLASSERERGTQYVIDLENAQKQKLKK